MKRWLQSIRELFRVSPSPSDRAIEIRLRKRHCRVLLQDTDMRLSSYYDECDRTCRWQITSEYRDSQDIGFKEGGDGYFHLTLDKGIAQKYSAYEQKLYCVYRGYEYSIDNITQDSIVLYPEEHRTRQYLNITSDRTENRIVIPYNDFIDSGPLVWETRSAVADFVFDVNPLVYPYIPGAYVEGNLRGPWPWARQQEI